MSVKVVLKFTKGGLKDREYSYDQKECVIIGRQSDCHIVVPVTDTTVSRYHCILDITPPSVTVRDFGSLNGTYLNGKKIGQGDIAKSVEERREHKSEEFPLNQGDRLGLANECELVMDVILPKYCADCFCEIEQSGCLNADNQPVCADCHTKAAKRRQEDEAARLAKEKADKERHEAEKRAQELAAQKQAAKEQAEKDRIAKELAEAQKRAEEAAKKEKEEEDRRIREEARRKAEEKLRNEELIRLKNPKCAICGATIQANGPTICLSCRNNPAKLIEYLMRQAIKEKDDSDQTIAGYRNIKMLGKGGMGAVWLVEEIATGQQMAMKLMLPDAASNEKSRSLFLREAYNACQLRHKNVVQHTKCGYSGSIFFILLEFCPGGSVDDYVKRNWAIFDPAINLMPANKITEKIMEQRVELSTKIILQTLDGLTYAHQAPVVVQLPDGTTKTAYGVVHRDFKPGNIFLSDTTLQPVAKVADFGLAKAFQTAGLTKDTVTGDAAGTPVFMPRQQIINYRYAKPDVDVWAAAACYYYLLTGFFPKNFTGKKDMCAVVLTEPHVPVLIRNPKIHRRLAEVLDTALRDNPTIGIGTAAELKRAIQSAIK